MDKRDSFQIIDLLQKILKELQKDEYDEPKLYPHPAELDDLTKYKKRKTK